MKNKKQKGIPKHINKEAIKLKRIRKTKQNRKQQHNLGPILCKKDIEPKDLINQLPQQSKDIFNHESYPGMYPGIKFNDQMKPIKVIRPLDLYELKLIVRLKSDIELRSDRIKREYERAGKT